MSGLPAPERRLVRGLGPRDATLLVIGSVLGGGIFATTGDMARVLPHEGVILLAGLTGLGLGARPNDLDDSWAKLTNERSGQQYASHWRPAGSRRSRHAQMGVRSLSPLPPSGILDR